MAEVTQADIDAAASAGDLDIGDLIQLFGRHRTEAVKPLVEALEDFCLSARCAAGVDEVLTDDQAHTEILLALGSAMAASFDRALAALRSVQS